MYMHVPTSERYDAMWVMVRMEVHVQGRGKGRAEGRGGWCSANAGAFSHGQVDVDCPVAVRAAMGK